MFLSDGEKLTLTYQTGFIIQFNAQKVQHSRFWILIGGGASGTISPVPMGYMPATTSLARRSFIDCGMQHRVGPMTPQHLSQVHLAPHGNHMVHLQHPAASSIHQQPRPGSSNTMTSDRISLGSGSDQFSVQSGGPRGGGQSGAPIVMPPQSHHQQHQLPVSSQQQQQVLYVYPQTTATTRRSQVIQPHQMLSQEALSPMFYRAGAGGGGGNNSSVGNLSVTSGEWSSCRLKYPASLLAVVAIFKLHAFYLVIYHRYTVILL